MRIGQYSAMCLALLLAAGGSSRAQHAFDHVLQPPLDLSAPATIFTAAGTIALASGGTIHILSGLPHALTRQSVTPSGSAAIGSPLHALGSGLALYSGLGTDGIASTSDDPLCFVSGLPLAPAVTVSSLLGVQPWFTSVNASTAARVANSGAAFEVLRFGTGSPALFTVPSPLALVSTSSSFGHGRVSDDAFVAYSSGPDLLAGTPDDAVVVLSGLAGSTFATAPHALGLAAPTGFVVTADGSGYAADAITAAGVPIAAVLTPYGTTFVYNTTVNLSAPGMPLSSGIVAGPRNTAILWIQDDLGPGVARCFVGRLPNEAYPSASASWYDDWNFGCSHAPVADWETCRDCAAGTGQPFTFTSWSPGATPAAQVIPSFGGDPIVYLRPSSRGLVRFADEPFGGGTRAVIFNSVPGAGSPTPFDIGGREFKAAHVLSPGCVAWFTGPSNSPADLLRVLAVGTFEVAGGALEYGSTSFLLASNPAAPVAGSQFQIHAFTGGIPANSTAYVLAVSAGLGPPLLVGTQPNQYTHLALDQFLGLVPMTSSAGIGSLALDLTSALPLAGIDVYVQAIALGSGHPLWLSDTWRFVIG